MWRTCVCVGSSNKSHIKFIRNFKSKWKVAAVIYTHTLKHSHRHTRALSDSFIQLYDLFTPFVWCFLFGLCSYQDILHIPTSFQQFSTSLGPIVDGHVIPNQPYKVMGHYTEHFSRFVKQLLSMFSLYIRFGHSFWYLLQTCQIAQGLFIYCCVTWLNVWHVACSDPQVKLNRSWNPSMHFERIEQLFASPLVPLVGLSRRFNAPVNGMDVSLFRADSRLKGLNKTLWMANKLQASHSNENCWLRQVNHRWFCKYLQYVESIFSEYSRQRERKPKYSTINKEKTFSQT